MVRRVAKSIKPEYLGKAIAEQLSLLSEDMLEDVNAAGEKAVKKLVSLTKKTAPKRYGDFKKAITYKVETDPTTGQKTFVWGAKAPHHRLVHLLVHGHQKQNGGRVSGDPFLEDALETVLPEYEKDVEEALKNAD